jgi:hypothetical protein
VRLSAQIGKKSIAEIFSEKQSFCPRFFAAPRRPWRGEFTPHYAVRACARFFTVSLKFILYLSLNSDILMFK